MSLEPKQYGCCSLIVVLAFAGVAGMCLWAVVIPAVNVVPGSAPPRRAASPRPPDAMPGDEVTLSLSGAKRVFLTVDDDAWSAMNAALGRGDSEELARLIDRGRVLNVKSGTRAKALKIGFMCYQVRIREGNNAEREAWVPSEAVHRAH